MAQAIALLRDLVGLLGLCNTCTEKVAASDEHAHADTEVQDSSSSHLTHDHSSLLTNVHFEGNDFSGCTIKNCIWTNVVFTTCRMSGVSFTNMRLTDVHILNIELDHARLQGVCLRPRLTWSDHVLTNVTITSAIFERVRSPTNTVLLRAINTSRHSKTIAFNKPSKTPQQTELSRSVIEPGPLRYVALAHVKPTTSLDLPSNILDNIASFLYPRNAAWVYDVPADLPGIRDTQQTTYELLDSGRPGRWTYIVLGIESTIHYLDRDYAAAWMNRAHFSTSFIRASKACRALGTKHIYSRDFRFRRSAQSCLAFMHDHHRIEHRITTLTLDFNLSNLHPTTRTEGDAWRHLFNVLVHQRPDLERCHLSLDREFWGFAPWRSGAEAVFETPVLCGIDTPGGREPDKRNFLQHVARLAGKGVSQMADAAHMVDLTEMTDVSRTPGPSYTFNERPGRVEFELIIAGSICGFGSSAFVKALWLHMVNAMAGRDTLQEHRYGICTEKELERSCYWKRPVEGTSSC